MRQGPPQAFSIMQLRVHASFFMRCILARWQGCVPAIHSREDKSSAAHADHSLWGYWWPGWICRGIFAAKLVGLLYAGVTSRRVKARFARVSAHVGDPLLAAIKLASDFACLWSKRLERFAHSRSPAIVGAKQLGVAFALHGKGNLKLSHH